ncbi:hypothetical protein TrLO_g15179 [Triparma laevis f. longispina]|uniref:Uncharacterized protein n=1 Tax=Triparma laevis f. longispina TaxID=1714387 RepID=A0A9W7FNY6_9STRA|nr:hypothetical protein TrLO_g15179 [Triparma laevis f. longispina]
MPKIQLDPVTAARMRSSKEWSEVNESGKGSEYVVLNNASVIKNSVYTNQLETFRSQVTQTLEEDWEFGIEELFELEVARHCEQNLADATINSMTSECHILLPYPPVIGGSISVDEIWSELCQPSSFNTVNRLGFMVRGGNKGLLWKREILRAVETIAEKEWENTAKRRQLLALKKWRQEERPEKLEKLYEVRNVFEKRRDAAKSKLNKVREKRIANHTEDLQGLDLAEEDFAFKKYQVGEDEDEVEGKPMSRADSDGDNSSASGSDSGGESADYECDDEDGKGKRNEERMRRRAEASKLREEKRRKKKQMQLEMKMQEIRVNAERGKVEEMKKKREEAEEKSKTEEEKLCEVLVKQLEDRLGKIDEILENLQEEEWEEEEDEGGLIDEILRKGEVEGDGEVIVGGGGVKVEQMTILDKLVASILGAQPLQPGTSKEAHWEKVRALHEEVKTEWKAEFGRLPPDNWNGEGEGGGEGGGGGVDLRGDGWGGDDDDVVVEVEVEKEIAGGGSVEGSGLDCWEDGEVEVEEEKEEEELILSTPNVAKVGGKGLRPGGRIG